MAIHSLDDVSVKCVSEYGEIKSLVAVDGGDLSVSGESPVIAHLSGNLGTADKVDAGRDIAPVKMGERITSCRGDRRLRRQVLRDIGNAHV